MEPNGASHTTPEQDTSERLRNQMIRMAAEAFAGAQTPTDIDRLKHRFQGRSVQAVFDQRMTVADGVMAEGQIARAASAATVNLEARVREATRSAA